MSTTGVGTFPIDVVTADFNNDGRRDAATADMYGGTITVLLGNGAGSFTKRTIGPLPLLYVPSGTPLVTGIATADMNGDGNADLVVSTFQGEYVAVFLGNGDGTFQAATTLNINPGGQSFPTAVAVGDMNGDGKPDVVVGRMLQSSVQILLGNGDGTLTRGPQISSGGSYPDAVKLADLNGDGALDAVVANNNSNTVSVLYGNGVGGWSGSATYSAPEISGNNPSPELNTLTVADIDGNGYPDVLVPANHATNGTITVLRGGPGGTFTPDSINIGANSTPWQVAFSDVNGDSIPDLVVSTWTTGVVVLPGLGGGSFAPPTRSYFYGPNFGLAVTDFTGDGRPDILAARPFYNEVGFARNTTVKLDTTPPVLAPHGDLTAEASSAQGAIVMYDAPTATDDVDPHPTVACLPASGARLPLGDTTVTCTATDASHNSSSETFVVHVVDTTPPALTPHPDVTVEATGPQGAVVTFTAPTATDLVDPRPAVACAPVAGARFALGDTTVTCTATDASLNASAETFVVHVVDTTPPRLTLPGDSTTNQNKPQGALVPFSAAATDLVDGSVGVACEPTSRSVFAPGSTTVTCSATDAHGNTARGSFTVTVRSASDQLAGLVARVHGVGPGKSLEQKAKDAQSKLAAGDPAGAASMLVAFENEVNAQSGKSIDAATAAELVAAAETIRAALGY